MYEDSGIESVAASNQMHDTITPEGQYMLSIISNKQTNSTTTNPPPLGSQLRAAGEGEHQAPRLVTRGAKSQDPHTEVSIDWLRMSGSRQMVEQALLITEEHFGYTKPDRGNYLLDSGYRWATGGIYLDTKKSQPAQHCVVDLPATILQEIEPQTLRQIIYDLHMIGFKTTRVDIACDYYDQPDLLNNVYDSCESGELCRSRTFQHIQTKNGRACTGRTVSIGKRGKNGSGRFVRVYDKGLETETHEQNFWIRWETELADDCATQFTTEYCQAADPLQFAHEHALWAIEFREYNGSRELERRPLVEWFQELVEGTTRRRLTATRTKSTVATYADWMRTSVLPKLKTITAITGTPLVGVIDHICGEVGPRADHTQCVKVRTICKSLGASNRQITTYGVYRGEIHE